MQLSPHLCNTSLLVSGHLGKSCPALVFLGQGKPFQVCILRYFSSSEGLSL